MTPKLATLTVDSIDRMQKHGVDGPYVLTAHPTLKKRILREHVRQACAEAGFEVRFEYKQYVPKNRIVIQQETNKKM